MSTPTLTYPVVWQPSGERLGFATTAVGAKRHARHVSILRCEVLSATLADRLIEPEEPEGEITFEMTWFVSPILRRR